MSDAVSEDLAGKPSAADLVEIFYAPSSVFARRRDGSFGLPLVVLVVVAGVLSFATSNLIQPALHADILRGMQPAVAAGKMTPEQAASATAVGEKFASAAAVGFFLVAPFVVGLISWIVARMVGIRQQLGIAVMIGTFSMFPRLIGIVGAAVLAVITPEGELTSATKLSLGPAHFVDVTVHPELLQLLGRLDLVVIWAYALIGIGMYVTGRSTKAQAWITAIGTWALLSLPAVYGAIRAG